MQARAIRKGSMQMGCASGMKQSELPTRPMQQAQLNMPRLAKRLKPIDNFAAGGEDNHHIQDQQHGGIPSCLQGAAGTGNVAAPSPRSPGPYG